jgi:hypothetical protein
MRKNKVFLEETKMHPSVKENMLLFDCVDVELALGIAKLNGRTNHKMITKEEKSTFKAKYESTARTLVRMSWLCNFSTALIEGLLNTDTELIPICQQAYKDHFAPNHPWVVRTAAGQALKFAGTREQARVAWGYESFEEMRPFVTALAKLRDLIHSELKKRDCLGLP